MVKSDGSFTLNAGLSIYLHIYTFVCIWYIRILISYLIQLIFEHLQYSSPVCHSWGLNSKQDIAPDLKELWVL